MAERLDGGELWLPSQFLTDDDILMDVNNSKSVIGANDLFGLEADGCGKPFSYEVPFGFGSSSGGSSDLSSPVESVPGSPETESDEEDYLAQLTRQMAHSTLEDDLWRNDLSPGAENHKGWVLSGSPQSTLCTFGSEYGCRPRSGRGNPNGTARVSSPPATWDLLFAAAGEMGRMRMIEQLDLYSHSRGFQGPPEKPSPVSVPVKNPIHDHAHYLQQPLANYQKLQASQFQQLMQQPKMKQQSSGVWGGQHSKGTGLYQLQQSQQMIHSGRNVGSRRLALYSSAWTPVQLAHQRYQSGSCSRAVFLGKPAGKECAGTGVFLPRRVGAPAETRKKSACSTVFVPPRVVQALNLNLEEMGAQPQFQSRLNGNLVPESDIALRLRGGNIKSNPKRNFRPQPGMSNEVRLPQEWTY